jgi:hypothetical protein
LGQIFLSLGDSGFASWDEAFVLELGADGAGELFGAAIVVDGFGPLLLRGEGVGEADLRECGVRCEGHCLLCHGQGCDGPGTAANEGLREGEPGEGVEEGIDGNQVAGADVHVRGGDEGEVEEDGQEEEAELAWVAGLALSFARIFVAV